MFSIGTVLSKLLGATPPHAAASNQRATPYTPLLFDVFEFVGAGPASEDSAEQQPEIAAGPAMVKIGSDLMQPYTKAIIEGESTVDAERLANFCRAIAGGMKQNQYHNAVHVIDVVQSTHALIHAGGLAAFLNAEDVFAVTLAAIIHDFEHKGLSNDFLVKTGDAWVKDAAAAAAAAGSRTGSSQPTAPPNPPNEHHHAVAALKLLESDSCNFMQHFDPVVKDRILKAVTSLVLATDMAKHKQLTDAMVSRLAPVLQEQAGAGGGRTALSCLAEPDNAELKHLAMHCLIKVSDLGHIYAPTHVHQRWAKRLEEEFFAQGDREKACGFEKVSLFMDRTKPDEAVTTTQDGFFKFVITPLFGAWCSCFPGCSAILGQAEANRLSWH